MRLSSDWFKSKTLLFAVIPAVSAAIDGVVTGQMKPLHAVVTVAGAVGAFALRDTIAKHKEETELVVELLDALIHQNNVHHNERMSTINSATAAHGRAATVVIEKAQLFQEAADLLGAARSEQDAAHEEDGEVDA